MTTSNSEQQPCGAHAPYIEDIRGVDDGWLFCLICGACGARGTARLDSDSVCDLVASATEWEELT